MYKCKTDNASEILQEGDHTHQLIKQNKKIQIYNSSIQNKNTKNIFLQLLPVTLNQKQRCSGQLIYPSCL